MRFLTILLIFLPEAVLAQDFRPISTRNHRAISLAFLRMPPAVHLAKGDTLFATSWTEANDFRLLDKVEEDIEVSRIAFTWMKGLDRRRTVWLEVPLLSLGGGFLDPIIESWHDNVLRWVDPGRASTPFGRSVVALAGVYRFGSATGIGDISAGISQLLSDGFRWQVAVKVPTGDASRLLGSGAADIGSSLEFRRPIGRRLCAFVQAGLVLQGKATKLPQSRTWCDQECLALIWQPNSRDAWIGQWNSERAPMTTGVPGVDATHRTSRLAFGASFASVRPWSCSSARTAICSAENFPKGPISVPILRSGQESK